MIDAPSTSTIVVARPFPAMEVREKTNAKAALGVALFHSTSEQVIELHIITPAGENSRHLTYGGPPNYSPRWAANMGLNWLRLVAEGEK